MQTKTFQTKIKTKQNMLSKTTKFVSPGERKEAPKFQHLKITKKEKFYNNNDGILKVV